MQAHFDAVEALIENDPLLVGKVEDTAKVDSAGALVRGTYVLLIGGELQPLSGGPVTWTPDDTVDAEYITTARIVSTTPAAVRENGSRVRAQAEGKYPVVAGRRCTKIRLDRASSVQMDSSAKPPLYYMDLDLVFISRRG